MRLPHIPQDSHEPLGIVIADGGHGDRPTRFSAFVWGPVPDADPVPVAPMRRADPVRLEVVAVPA